MLKDNFFDVLRREFPICYVAQGLIGNPLNSSKGKPMSEIIILTKYDGQGVYCGLSTASEVFLIFTTQIYSLFMHLKCPIVKESTRREYCPMNTPSLQYFMLLTSGG